MPTHPRLHLTIPNLDAVETAEELSELADAMEQAAAYARTLAREAQAQADGRLNAVPLFHAINRRRYARFPAWLQWTRQRSTPV